MNTIEKMLEALKDMGARYGLTEQAREAIAAGERELAQGSDAEFNHAVKSWKANEELDRETIDDVLVEAAASMMRHKLAKARDKGRGG